MAGALTASDSSATNASTYTFTNKDIGATASDRVIYIGVEFRHNGTTADFAAVNPVTIGGTPATLVKKLLNTLDGANTNGLGIFKLALSTGTAADIVVNLSVMVLRCAIQVWRSTDIDASAAHDTAEAQLTSGNPTDTIDIPANGFMIAIGMNAANTTVSWTGPTEDVETVVESNTIVSGASLNDATGHSGYTVTYTPTNNAGGPTMIAVSWASSASPITISLSAISTTGIVVAPSLTIGTSITPSPISTNADIVEPLIDIGNQVSIDTLSSRGVITDQTVTYGSTISLDSISTNGLITTQTISVENAIVLDTIVSNGEVVSPEAEVITGVALSPISTNGIVLSPVISYANSITLSPLSTNGVIQEPIVTVASAIILTSIAVSGALVSVLVTAIDITVTPPIENVTLNYAFTTNITLNYE